MPILSIIILSYNTKDITKQCLEKLTESLSRYPTFSFEIIIVDNGSADTSQDMIRAFKESYSNESIQIKTIFNEHNEGFPKGNNAGIANASGTYILFLNSDVMVDDVKWDKVLAEFELDTRIAALSVRVTLPNGQIDPASHRGFPTVWNSFCYYTKLEALTRHIPLANRLCGGYHLTYEDLHVPHEVDAISGAFFLARKDVVQELGGFDETFFMYGEDIDLAYRMKTQNYVLWYYPESRVTHLKYQSGLKNQSKGRESTTKTYFYDAMRIFYKKHYESRNPWIVNRLVYLFIDLKSRF
ncbi:glycosyltransferase family 2 protein [Candidatus Woesebacteria bacterium]|nr:glycosyltransferase family 2 protein [Candidatus Woesebacteria bacterium]